MKSLITLNSFPVRIPGSTSNAHSMFEITRLTGSALAFFTPSLLLRSTSPPSQKSFANCLLLKSRLPPFIFLSM
ncbi:hypothetical protein Sjap_009478 [Stephania japonica]|uniref:Uncharacterized protein n=1 Tax=Stephania japonica TaxID=461633 RepID=A0AAP0JSX9_9MAGN